MHTQLSLTALAAGLFCGLASGQTCTIVQDLNATGSGFSSNPDGAIIGNNAYAKDSFAQLGLAWYFRADTSATGEELFRTDGTSATPTLVRDINPGAPDSSIAWLTSYGGKLWFSASTPTEGSELWVSDGTLAGTQLVKDINPGTGSSSISNITGMGGKVFFAARDASNGSELWMSDGTAAGTQLVLDIRPGSSSSNLSRMVLDPASGKLLFAANDGSNGTEPWISDGTPLGTTLLNDIQVGTGSSFAKGFTPFNGEVFFTASSPGVGSELWKTNGTGAGTVLVKDIRPGTGSSSPDMNYFAIFNNELYFRANDGSTGTELIKTDGTTAGTVQVADLRPGSSSSFPADMIVYNGAVYFSGDDGVAGRELWRTTGTPASTTLVADIQPGSGSGFGFGDNNFMVNAGLLFMKAKSSGNDNELWRTTGATTSLVKDIEVGSIGSNPDWLTPISPTQMIFTADTVAEGEELWVTDGSSANTVLLAEVDNSFISKDANPEQMHSVDGQYLLMNAEDGLLGEELYRWDNAGGVSLVKDIRPGSLDSLISGFTTAYLGGKYQTFFAANDGVNGTELWVSDGTPSGTSMLKDIFVGSDSSSPREFYYHEMQGVLYFQATDSLAGTELWRTDGTSAGTVMVVDIATGVDFFGNPDDSDPAELAAFGAQLVFRANDGNTGTEPWITDGTALGTSQLGDLNTFGSTPRDFNQLGAKLIFTASSNANGAELFESDGTLAGTQLLVDIRPGTIGSNPSKFAMFNGELFFAASDGVSGTELWKTDGTALGTSLVADIRVGSFSGSPDKLTVANGKLYFSGSTGSLSGRELWSTDGTSAGTAIVADINPANQSSSPEELTPAGLGLYFAARGIDGKELYFSDGTAGGTFQVCDFNPGPSWGSPASLALCGGDLLFSGDDVLQGKELVRVALPGAYVQDFGASGNGSKLTSTFPVLGTSATVAVDNVPAGSLSLLIMSAPNGGPTHSLTDASSLSWIDPVNFTILSVFTTTSFTVNAPVPATPSIAGAQLHLQAWALPPAVLPASTSNALQLVLGN